MNVFDFNKYLIEKIFSKIRGYVCSRYRKSLKSQPASLLRVFIMLFILCKFNNASKPATSLFLIFNTVFGYLFEIIINCDSIIKIK